MTKSHREVVDTPLLAGDLVAVLAAHYARLLNTWDGEPDPKFEAKLRVLRGLAGDIALIQKTIHQATLQKNQFEQKNRDDRTRETDELKKQTLAPILASLKSRSLAKIFGGGDYGQKAAEFITAVQHELPMPQFDTEPPSSQAQSNPVKPESPPADNK